MNKFNSIFGQILKLFPRVEFEGAVRETGDFHLARAKRQGVHLLATVRGYAVLSDRAGALAQGDMRRPLKQLREDLASWTFRHARFTTNSSDELNIVLE